MAMPKLNQLPPPLPRIGMWEPISTAQPTELDMSRNSGITKVYGGCRVIREW